MRPGFQGLGFPGHFGTDLRQTGPVYGFLAIPRNASSSSGAAAAAREWRGKDAAGFFVGHDGCDPFPPEEAARVRGRVAVLLRGGCSFLSKARRVEEAGGIGAILVDLEGLDFEAIHQAKAVVASQQAAAASTEQQEADDSSSTGGNYGSSAAGQQEQPPQQQQQQPPQRNPVYTSWQVRRLSAVAETGAFAVLLRLRHHHHHAQLTHTTAPPFPSLSFPPTHQTSRSCRTTARARASASPRRW